MCQVIRAFSREKHEEERFEDANAKLTKTNLFVNRCMTFMMPFMMLLMNAITVLIVLERFSRRRRRQYAGR